MMSTRATCLCRSASKPKLLPKVMNGIQTPRLLPVSPTVVLASATLPAGVKWQTYTFTATPYGGGPSVVAQCANPSLCRIPGLAPRKKVRPAPACDAGVMFGVNHTSACFWPAVLCVSRGHKYRPDEWGVGAIQCADACHKVWRLLPWALHCYPFTIVLTGLSYCKLRSGGVEAPSTEAGQGVVPTSPTTASVRITPPKLASNETASRFIITVERVDRQMPPLLFTCLTLACKLDNLEPGKEYTVRQLTYSRRAAPHCIRMQPGQRLIPAGHNHCRAPLQRLIAPLKAIQPCDVCAVRQAHAAGLQLLRVVISFLH